ncbi:hypothetical protein IQ270_12050 [Microcoleus sp. LEGE 07076]|uniref:hypothetical protein n=1 Tax=Microcoleus sp. LEGE 07076 TaxID=915322 RepID=UPI00188177A0|nr:hypothetical protein [Microcoleus sp. LEGE 07076]MBE9185418.1 hypothetical protein [Microcoleus sp. LEGE 07076]
MKIKNLVISGMALLLGTAIVGNAIAQELTDSQKTVVCRLKTEVDQRSRSGQKLVFVPLLGQVRKQVSSPFRATLHPDTEYTFVATCDGNCQDLNLTLKDANGQEIGTSQKTGELSSISFTPPSQGEYQITAKPGECTTAEGCSFGMGIFVPTSASVPNASKIPAEIAQFKLCQ